MATQPGSSGRDDCNVKVWTVSDFGTQALTPMSTSDKLKVYSQWANSYEKDGIQGDYVAWRIVLEKLLNVIPKMASGEKMSRPIKILDVGCGTGYLGMILKEELKTSDVPITLIGLDFSKEMLEQARKKNCYDELLVGDVTKPLREEAHGMDIVVAVGVFLEGHCDASALPNVLASLHRNGIGLITIRSTTLAKVEGEYLQAVTESKCDIIEREERLYVGPAMAEYWTLRKTEGNFDI